MVGECTVGPDLDVVAPGRLAAPLHSLCAARGLVSRSPLFRNRLAVGGDALGLAHPDRLDSARNAGGHGATARSLPSAAGDLLFRSCPRGALGRFDEGKVPGLWAASASNNPPV